MRTVNTSELTGEPLNWAVGKADGRVLRVEKAQYGIGARVFEECRGGSVRYRPIIDWGQCGPLLEKHRLMICPQTTGSWLWNGDGVSDPLIIASDPRTAICRAVVAAVSGPVVDVPGELF